MSTETLQAEAPWRTTTTSDGEAAQPFVFSFLVQPGMSQPEVEIFGPASLTSVVTTLSADIDLELLQKGFPPGITYEFDSAEPLVWRSRRGIPIEQPDWIADLVTDKIKIHFAVKNPAGITDPKGLTEPIIASFVPRIVERPSGEVLRRVPDPTIVNIDPTGG